MGFFFLPVMLVAQPALGQGDEQLRDRQLERPALVLLAPPLLE